MIHRSPLIRRKLSLIGALCLKTEISMASPRAAGLILEMMVVTAVNGLLTMAIRLLMVQDILIMCPPVVVGPLLVPPSVLEVTTGVSTVMILPWDSGVGLPAGLMKLAMFLALCMT